MDKTKTTSTVRKPVQVVEFIAPEQRKPSSKLSSSASSSSFVSRKRSREDDNSSHNNTKTLLSSSSSSAGGLSFSTKGLPNESLQDIYKSVTSLGATSLHGKEKKIFEAKQLAELGVHLEHKIKMPYKMYKGVMKARQHREAKQQEYARLSGLVVPKVINNKDNKDDERKKRYEDNDADDDPTPRNIRGPVMYLTGNNNNKSHHKKNHNHHRTMNKFGKNK